MSNRADQRAAPYVARSGLRRERGGNTSPTNRRKPMKVLYLGTTGAQDPTKASLPLHIAANGSVEAGQECAVVLAGDATDLVARETAERLEGVGIPPVRDLVAKLRDHAVPVYV